MKSLKVVVFALLAMSFMFQSCDKILDPPAEDEKDKVDKLSWYYDLDEVMYASLINPTPAIDENGNIYITADVKGLSGGTQIMKLSSGGAKLWSIKKNNSVVSRPIYQDGKLYFLLGTSLYCLNADDGSEIWSVEEACTSQIISITNNKIYLTRWEDVNVLGKNYLEAYDLDGNKIWSEYIKYSDTDTVNFPYAMSVRDNQIYLGVLAEVGESNFAIINYQDDGSQVSKNWTWLGPENFTTDNQYHFKDLPIDDNNNLYFNMQHNGDQYIFSITSEGTDNWSKVTSMDRTINSLAVDEEGNCYYAYDKCEKLNASGDIWISEPKKDWTYEGLDAQAPVLSKNGTLAFCNSSSLLTSLKADGSFNWEQYVYPCDVCTEEFHNLTIAPNGNIIIISKTKVYSFIGDGSGLAEKGWPKVYGNYGNTASK